MLSTHVAPLAGAWIEITNFSTSSAVINVAPLAGAWIEMQIISRSVSGTRVAPLAGAWIEIVLHPVRGHETVSLPSRERGLK